MSTQEPLMAEPVPDAPPPPLPLPLAPNPLVPLNEFCARLSGTDSQFELIGAFALLERNAGRTSDTAANYAARYAVLGNRVTI